MNHINCKKRLRWLSRRLISTDQLVFSLNFLTINFIRLSSLRNQGLYFSGAHNNMVFNLHKLTSEIGEALGWTNTLLNWSPLCGGRSRCLVLWNKRFGKTVDKYYIFRKGKPFKTIRWFSFAHIKFSFVFTSQFVWKSFDYYCEWKLLGHFSLTYDLEKLLNF